MADTGAAPRRPKFAAPKEPVPIRIPPTDGPLPPPPEPLNPLCDCGLPLFKDEDCPRCRGARVAQEGLTATFTHELRRLDGTLVDRATNERVALRRAEEIAFMRSELRVVAVWHEGRLLVRYSPVYGWMDGAP